MFLGGLWPPLFFRLLVTNNPTYSWRNTVRDLFVIGTYRSGLVGAIKLGRRKTKLQKVYMVGRGITLLRSLEPAVVCDVTKYIELVRESEKASGDDESHEGEDYWEGGFYG